MMISIPYHGSKKTAYKYVWPIVEEGGYDKVYEPFGGSGVLSMNLYKDGYVDTVRINDFDDFFGCYREYLDYKDWIVQNCEDRGMVKTNCGPQYGTYKRINGKVVKLKTALLNEEDKKFLQGLVKQVPGKYWRYLALGSNFTFPGVAQHEVIRISDFIYYANYLETDKQREYMDWIDRVDLDHCDYREFLEKYKDELDERSLLIIDPPYVGTDQIFYKGQFDRNDTKELIDRLKELKVDFIFFNNDKEAVEEYLDGLNIVNSDEIATGKRANKAIRNRNEYFAYVKFDRKKKFKCEKFNPVVTGLSERSPTYTIKDGFVDNEKVGV